MKIEFAQLMANFYKTGDNVLKDNQRKYLTEKVLEECWHELEEDDIDRDTCIKCKKIFYDLICQEEANRTFSEPDDFFAVVRELDAVSFADCLEGIVKHDIYDIWDVTETMQQPDFIEKFMEQVCKIGGVE